MDVHAKWKPPAAALLAAICIGPPVTAAATVWNIDSANSFITLAAPQQTVNVDGTNYTVRTRNQVGSSSSWTQGNRSALSGTLETITNFNTMIDFLGGSHNIDGLTSGNWDPLAGGGEGTAAADFGVKVQAQVPILGFLDAAFAALRNASYDVESGVVPINADAFAASGLTVGILGGTLDYRGVGLAADPIGSGTTSISPSSDVNSLASPGSISITGLGGIGTLNIPINIDLVIPFSGGSLNVQATGQIRATTQLPLAGDANMDGVVDIFDVNVISDNWNGPPPMGDVNYDGAVDIFDVNTVSDHWGQGGGSAAAVPEPATWLLIVLGTLGCLARRLHVLSA